MLKPSSSIRPKPAPIPPKPAYVVQLEAVYGAPSQAGFGSAVFCALVAQAEDLETAALYFYRYFVGDLWERYGETAWMAPWRAVYRRQSGGVPNIVAELRAIADPIAQLSVPLLLEANDSAAAQKALAHAYDDAAVSHLAVYTLGDGAAMAGLLVAGRRTSGEATFLVLLMD